MLKKPIGYDEVEIKEAMNVPILPRGNYVCRISGVEQIADGYSGTKLRMSFDIDEGENKGFYVLKYEHESKNPFDGQQPHWKGNIYLKLPNDFKQNETEDERKSRERSVQSFKKSILAFEDSNEGFHFDWADPAGERQFLGKIVGIKFEPNEYTIGDKTGEWQKPKYFCSVDRIRDGKEKILPLREQESKPIKYVPPTNDSYQEIPDEELPF